MIEIVSRAEWKAAPPTKPFLSQGIVDNFFLHHSVTPDIGNEKEEMRRIDLSHKASGARAIDYGFCLGRTGTFYEGRGWFVQDGATATGFGAEPDGNYYGREVTVCLLGNYENLKLSDEIKDLLREFIAMAVDLKALKKNPVIRGHRDVRATACPGQNAYDRLDDIKVPWEEDDMALNDKELSALAYTFGQKERAGGDVRPTKYESSDGKSRVKAAQAGWDDKDAEMAARPAP
jgi:N-acetylmuramoyl-L-alanine amidase